MRWELRAAALPAGSTILAAVSGGADSTALLIALVRLCRPGGFVPVACYVDHQLRGRGEIEAEQLQLRQRCAELGVRLELVMAPLSSVLPSAGRRRGSPEEQARKRRYEALSATALRLGAVAVATGHTADDQAETVLLRLLRGTGPLGLAAMRRSSQPWGSAGPLLLRPLLRLRRSDTERYCRERGVPWSTDSSNASPQFLRNRVRRELMPAVESLAPDGVAALARLAGLSADLADWIASEAGRLAARLIVERGDGADVRRPDPNTAVFLEKALLAQLLGRLMAGQGAPSERVVAAARGIWLGHAGREAALGRGLWAVATRDGMRVERRPPRAKCDQAPDS